MGEYSDFLFVRPSFAEGMARLLDTTGAMNIYNTSPSSAEADRLALEMDWDAVGEDIRTAMREADAENVEKIQAQ